MTNISKNPLSKGQLDQLFLQMSTLVSELNTKQVHLFLGNLLGVEERIMLAKRLGAILLLVQGQTIYKTAQALHLSTGTVSRIDELLSQGEYNDITTLIKRNKKGFIDLLDALDNILHLGGLLPHYNGLDRYRTLR